jgi:GxxExxY protein
MDTNIKHREISFRQEAYDIVGAGMRVWNTLGYGFLEKVYENSLVVELRLAGFDVKQQHPIRVVYREHVVGDYIADILVNDTILIELKTCKRIEDVHIAQTLNYLKATGLPLGIILDFAPNRLESKRLVV